MRITALLIGWAWGLGFATHVVAETTTLTITYSETLKNVRASQQDQTTTLTKSTHRAGSPLSLSFDAFGQRFELHLEDNTSLKTLSSKTSSGAYRLLKGKLSHSPNSWARITLYDGAITGIFNDGIETYVIEPGTQKNASMIYRMHDVSLTGFGCGSHGITTDYTGILKDLEQQIVTKTGEAAWEIDVSILAGDYYREQWGHRAVPDMLAAFNAVDGIFSEQLGIQVRVVESNKTLLPMSDGEKALESLAQLREREPSLRSTGLTHLYTAVDLEVTEDDLTRDVVGIAYIDTLCSNHWGVGITQVGHSFIQEALVTAHELGHNFGAVHDGLRPCAHVPESYLMAPNYQGFPEFSRCSLEQMQSRAVRASCISPLNRIDVQVAATDDTIKAAPGAAFDHTFEIINRGSSYAHSVALDVTSSNLTILNGSPSAGICTAIPSGVTCDVQPMPIGASRLVTVTAVSDVSGEMELLANSRVSQDVALDNNQHKVAVIVKPPVNLQLAFDPMTHQISDNQPVDLVLKAVNDHTAWATDVDVQVAIPAGLGLDSVASERGTCTVADASVRCQMDLLQAQQQFEITLSVVGKSQGNHWVSATIDSAELDLNEKDNFTGTSVAVSSSNLGRNDTLQPASGGGALVWLLFLLTFLCHGATKRTKAM